MYVGFREKVYIAPSRSNFPRTQRHFTFQHETASIAQIELIAMFLYVKQVATRGCRSIQYLLLQRYWENIVRMIHGAMYVFVMTRNRLKSTKIDQNLSKNMKKWSTSRFIPFEIDSSAKNLRTFFDPGLPKMVQKRPKIGKN